ASADTNAAAIPATAAASALAPAFSLDYPQVIPAAVAASLALPPTPTSDTNTTSAVSAAGATALPPTVAWTQPPSITTYTANDTVNVTDLRNSGYTHLILVGVGGGEAATNGSFITGQGGKAGSWNNATIDLAAYPSLTSITITRGNGGSRSGGDGTATTFVGDGGMPTLTCAGGSGNTGIQAGGGPGNVTVDGDTYTGGARQISGGAAGNAPGGGGGGGNLFGNGGAGAEGRAWIKAKRI
ncbi:hypothetical protein ABFW11_29405, partial [Mycolicibacterium porcinum]